MRSRVPLKKFSGVDDDFAQFWTNWAASSDSDVSLDYFGRTESFFRDVFRVLCAMYPEAMQKFRH